MPSTTVIMDASPVVPGNQTFNPPPQVPCIQMEIRTVRPPPPTFPLCQKIKNSSEQETYRRPDAKHNRHQRMLLQLCLEIRPPNPPPPAKFPSNKDGNQNPPPPSR